MLATLSTHEKFGQLLMPVIFPADPHEVRVTEELRALLAEGGIGGYFVTSAGSDAPAPRLRPGAESRSQRSVCSYKER